MFVYHYNVSEITLDNSFAAAFTCTSLRRMLCGTQFYGKCILHLSPSGAIG